MPDLQTAGFRAGYVALVGNPNVGKSTLMNVLIGQKLSIVSSKPQTTRHRVLGIVTRESFQIIFLDTPGVIDPKYPLQDAMMITARNAAAESDLIFYMIDATAAGIGKSLDSDPAFRGLRSAGKPAFLLINKVDCVRKVEVADLIAWHSSQYQFTEVFPISALHGTGLEDLLPTAAAVLPLHPPLYPEDMVSEHTERFFVSEIIRQHIFDLYREEIPYSTSVSIREFKEEEGKKDHIEADIFVERDSQKGILIGHQGKALKTIGERSRKEIELFLGRPVYLTLFVKVRENWRRDDTWIKRFGY